MQQQRSIAIESISISVLFRLIIVITLPLNVNAQLPYTQDSVCGYLNELPGDLRTQVPWHAAIFGRTGSKHPFTYQLSGTLISPNVVITLFSGEYGKPSSVAKKYFIPRADNYIVVLGLKSSNLNDSDEHTQVIPVSYILPFNGHKDQNLYHFFAFHLKTPANVTTPYARNVCIPLFLRIWNADSYGRSYVIRQAGFARRTGVSGSGQLTVLNVTNGNRELCSTNYNKHYPGSYEHVMCGRISPTDLNNPSCLDPGTGRVLTLYNNRWSLGSIAALIPVSSEDENWCKPGALYFYARLVRSLAWIHANIKCSGDMFPCSEDECVPLSSVCDQKFDCSNKEDEDPIYCRALKPCIFRDRTWGCGVYGKCLTENQVCDGHRDCEDGSDESNSDCERLLPKNSRQHDDDYDSDIMSTRGTGHCPVFPIVEGIQVVCETREGVEISCKNVQLGSIARHTCRRFYTTKYRAKSFSTTCQMDRTWKPSRTFTCEPECGTIANPRAFIYGGKMTNRNNAFPWHVALFRKENDIFQFICGGSLIEKTVLLTAAHCVYDVVVGPPSLKSQLRIALGSNSSDYAEIQSNPSIQISHVKSIFIPITYNKITLQSDIALIELEKPAIFGDTVRPVCYLGAGEFTVLKDGTLGKVSGFGFKETNKLSDNLLYAEFPVVAMSECRASLQATPPLSTFCAGYKNGTAVCHGDSGGGMVFLSKFGKYYLKGVVSHGEAKYGKMCDTFNYAVFTHVDAYADWILQKVESTLRK